MEHLDLSSIPVNWIEEHLPDLKSLAQLPTLLAQYKAQDDNDRKEVFNSMYPELPENGSEMFKKQ